MKSPVSPRTAIAEAMRNPAAEPELRLEPMVSLASVHGSIMLSLKVEGARTHWSGE